MSQGMTYVVRAVATVILASSTLMVATSASAAAPAQEGQLKVVSTHKVTSSECVAKVQARGGSGREVAACTSTVTLAVGAETHPSSKDVASARSALSPREFEALSAAAVAGTVRAAPFQQGKNNGTDQEEQYGRVYYDGSRVWIATYGGYTGSHICKVDWAVGYDVTNTGCGDYGSSSQRSIYQKWKFSLGVKGSPVSWEETSTIFVNASGRFWQ